MKMSKGMALPVDMLMASDKELDSKKLNQCGPNGPLNSIIPNHLLGLGIFTSCDVHDWTYLAANNQQEHKKSDTLFLKNMKTDIKNKTTNSVLKYFRYGLAYIYFGATRLHSFFKKKSPQNSSKIARKTLK